MKKSTIYGLLAVWMVQATCSASLNNAFERSTVDLPEAVVQDGQVGAYINDVLLLAGGLDSSGNESDRIFVLREISPGEFEVADEFDWDRPIGLCKSASNSEGLYVSGLSSSPGSEIYRISYTDEGLVTNQLKPMPGEITVIGLDLMGSLLCVFGLDGRSGANVLYTLRTDSPEADWEIVRGFPGEALKTASVRVNYDMVHIFGGILQADGSPTAACFGWRERPVDGMTQKGWVPLASLPGPASEATTFVTGQAHIGYLGNPAGESSTALSPLLLYHSITDTWVPALELPTSMTNASVVRIDDSFVFIGKGTNGEVPALLINPTVSSLKIADYIIMLIYFMFLGVIGAYFARKQNNSEEFSLGGRNVKWWAAAISMFATGASAISFMAIPSQVFRTNLIWLFPIIIVIPLFYFIQAYLLFPLLRRLNIVSTYEYLQRRFHPSLRILASLQCIAFQTFGRISVVILLPALAISAVTGLDVSISILLMGLITTLYTTFGGYEAVVWTDVLQGLLMIGGIGLMIGFAVHGIPGGTSELLEVGKQYHKFDFFLGGWDIAMALGGFLIMRQLAESFAFTADQPVIQRLFSIPMDKVRKLSAMFAVFAILIAVLVQFMGVTIFGYFHANPGLMNPFMTNDQVVPLFVTKTMPPGVSGLIIAALFAASMSTLSSSINSVSTLVAEDFFIKLFKRSTDKQKLLVMKATSMLVGLFGTGTALYMGSLNIQSMFQLWLEIAALIGGGFVGMYFLGMFTKRANSPGVIVGAIFSVVCLILVKNYTPIHWSLYQAIAILACVVVGYAASLFLPHKERDLTGLTVFTPASDQS
jgi:solute:Na+ symporter, SSS family